MRRRETWGAALLAAAVLAAWCGQAVNEAHRAAAGRHLLLYVGVPGSSITYSLLVVAFLAGAAGMLLLVPALIRRIPLKWVRRTVGWTSALAAVAAAPFLGLMLFFVVLLAVGFGDYVKVVAPDGQSVLISQDDFDGDRVDIYMEHDGFTYKFHREAPELSGWPRVEDQGCQLETVKEELMLTCGAKVLSLKPEEFE
jgi:hypothetical protein